MPAKRELRGRPAQCRDGAHILLAFRVPGIVRGLHTHPDSCAVPKQLAEPDRNSRRDRLALSQYVIEVLAGNAEKLRNFRLRPAGCRDYVLSQQRPGMGRAAVRVALGSMSHDLSSMVLLEVDSIGVAFFELECDAPGSVHVNRIAGRLEASQGMKIKTRDIHFLWPRRRIEPVKTTKDASMHPRIDLRCLPCLPEFSKSPVPEAPNHIRRCKQSTDECQLLAYLCSLTCRPMDHPPASSSSTRTMAAQASFESTRGNEGMLNANVLVCPRPLSPSPCRWSWRRRRDGESIVRDGARWSPNSWRTLGRTRAPEALCGRVDDPDRLDPGRGGSRVNRRGGSPVSTHCQNLRLAKAVASRSCDHDLVQTGESSDTMPGRAPGTVPRYFGRRVHRRERWWPRGAVAKAPAEMRRFGGLTKYRIHERPSQLAHSRRNQAVRASHSRITAGSMIRHQGQYRASPRSET